MTAFLCWMQLCPSRSYAHWRCASDVISEQKKWPQFYHPFPLSVIQYISIVNLLVVHFHSCKTQCDSMSLVVSGSLLLQTFLQTTRARRFVDRSQDSSRAMQSLRLIAIAMLMSLVGASNSTMTMTTTITDAAGSGYMAAPSFAAVVPWRGLKFSSNCH